MHSRTASRLEPADIPAAPLTPAASQAGVDLYWLPPGAGGWFVKMNGRIWEAVQALWQRRRPLDLYHTAVVVRVPEGRFVVENCWPIPDADGPSRGVLVEGPVASRSLGRCRVFRYEVRCWPEGVIADAGEAVASPQLLSDDPVVARRLLELVRSLPSPVWGRDEFQTGEMWNSNSVIAWLVAQSGLPTDAIQPPAGGRAPGWQAGLAVAHRSPETITSPDVKAGRTEGQDAHDAAVGAGGPPAPTARASQVRRRGARGAARAGATPPRPGDRPGTPLVTSARLRMRGHIKVGRWLPFRAHQLLNPHNGFVWTARAAGIIAGSDRYLDGDGGLDWKLLGLLTVAHAQGPDVSRSAAARAGAEAIWLPTALLPRFGVRWSAGPGDQVTAGSRVGDTALELRLRLDAAGRITSLVFDRWGDPDNRGTFAQHRFGGEFTGYRSFQGLTIPSQGRLGWFCGQDRWPAGEFFRYQITDLEPVTGPGADLGR